jgi:eukaryotic-like serine/threonine-protein kinase
MTSQQIAEVRRLFDEALEIQPEHRPVWLADRASGDILLEVQRLLEGHEKADSVLGRLEASIASSRSGALAGQRVGAYELLEPIGHGGMGSVYRAARADDSYRKTVAVKLLGLHCGGPEMELAFHKERQILANLEHPNIAHLIDGGTSPDGLAFIVMELVEGLPIDEYCASKKLSIDARLALFAEVCGAVEYAHRNLIVHRDLKPSNILVTEEGQVKLLDFGIAKVLAESPAAVATVTLPRMTPKYASPEQLQMQPITTSSDVYSLSVVLYELLTGGVHPYQTTGESLRDTVTAVCEQDPPRPSDVAQTNFRNQVRGELDNVVLKAMAKRPADRYTSVEQLADDIRRYRTGLPVHAQGHALHYRARKFIQRNFTLVAAAGLLVIALAAGVVATLYQAGVANRQRAIAERRYNDVRALATAMLFGIHDSIRNLPGAAEARKLTLSKSLEYLEALAKDSAGDAALESELAAAYERAGELMGSMFDSNIEGSRAAIPILEKAIALRRRAAAERGDPDAVFALAMGYYRFGNGQFSAGYTDDAITSFRQGVDVAVSMGEDLRGRSAQATLQAKLCNVYNVTSHASETLALCREAIANLAAMLQRKPKDEDIAYNLAMARAQLGNALRVQGKIQEAIPAFRASATEFRNLIRSNPDSARSRHALASVQVRLTTALAAVDEVPRLDDWRIALNAVEASVALDPQDYRMKSMLGYVLQKYSAALEFHQRRREAESAYRRALSIYQDLVAKPKAGAVEMNDLSNALVKSPFPHLRDATRALQLAERANELADGRNPLILDTLAWAYYRSGQISEAVETSRRALALLPARGAETGLRKEISGSLAEFQRALRP